MREISMTVTKNGSGDDVFRLCTDSPVDVNVTGDCETEQLRNLFKAILTLLLKDDVVVSFSKTEGYGTAMYEDVCREYVTVLNAEIRQARARLQEEDLCEFADDRILEL